MQNRMITTLLVIFCCILVVKSETCIGSHEKSIFSGIKSSIKTLEEKLEGKSPRCRPGWKEYKDSCYFFSKDKKPWQEAEVDCRNLGGYLTQVTDSGENSWIVTMIKSKKVTQQHYWMGATDFKEGDWRWVNDLSKVTYTDWNTATHEPTNAGGIEDCAHFWHGQNYKWNDQPCKDAFAYICESPQGSNCLPYSRLLKSSLRGKK
ncbi:perlucin-like protein isoform X2 [Mytilus californianus]|uniref:perlucin-like protein isoform X2 n=1 Tax=Mytilus californianus TaxID=6549 RepID=UPI002245B830|nr:perlucin-like protein isoform X2 [Mytilus californianus]